MNENDLLNEGYYSGDPDFPYNPPTIDWIWDGVNNILTITAIGNGSLLLEVIQGDQVLQFFGENEVSYQTRSQVGFTHKARTCVLIGDRIVSYWYESNYIVTDIKQNNEFEPNFIDNPGYDDNNGVIDEGQEIENRVETQINVSILEKENIITQILEDYFNKWVIGDNCISFPYYIDKKQKSMTQEEWNEIKNLQHKMNILLQETCKEAEIDRENYRKHHIHDYQLYSTKIDDGKNFPEILQRVHDELSKTIDSLIEDETLKNCSKYEQWKNCSFDVIKLMEICGIGIDCSGFVSRALATIFEKMEKSFEDQKRSLGEGVVNRLKTNISHYVSEDSISTKGRCVNPSKLRPGDIICNNDHVIIVSKVNRESNEMGYNEYVTMESSARNNKDINTGKKMVGVTKRILKIQDNKDISKHIIDIDNRKYVAIRVPILNDYYNNDSDYIKNLNKVEL